MNKKENPLMQFLAGLVMLAAGLYWFMSSVHVTTGFGSFMLGSFRVGTGLVIIPFLVGIVLLFYNFDSILAKLITMLGIIIILASIIMNTHFYFTDRNLYEYLLMILFIFGGGTLVLKVLLMPIGDEDKRGSKKKN